MTEYLRLEDHTAQPVEKPNDDRNRSPGRKIAKSVIDDLKSAMRFTPGWTEWQQNILRKAIRELEAIR